MGCSSVLASLLTVLGAVAMAVAFVTPFWIEEERTGKNRNLGLWQACTGWENCTRLVTKNDTDSLGIGNWFHLIQGLSSLAMLLQLLMFVVSFCMCCCCQACKGANCLIFTGVILIFSFALCLLSVTIFGVKARDNKTEKIFFDTDTHYSFSFYCCMLSGLSCLLAAIFYFCSVPQARRVANYQVIGPTV